MSARTLSSGDLIADRRADYAEMLAGSGDPAAAAELMAQALEIVPDWAAGWFLAGEYLEKSGRTAQARDAYERVLSLAPDDVFGAGLKLALLDAGKTPAQPPVAYVEQLFDDYAERFETALVEKLEYKVPQSLRELIEAHGAGTYRRTIDFGCGTGLMGTEIRFMTEHLEGYDLSANMLAKAEEKRIYDRLGQADLSRGLAENRLFEDDLGRGRADLATAADVLMYLGDLDPLFELVRALLAPHGEFAFSVEASAKPEGFHLQSSLRYAHSPAYVEAALVRHGLQPLARRALVIRMDRGEPVHGLLFLARLKRAA